MFVASSSQIFAFNSFFENSEQTHHALDSFQETKPSSELQLLAASFTYRVSIFVASAAQKMSNQ